MPPIRPGQSYSGRTQGSTNKPSGKKAGGFAAGLPKPPKKKKKHTNYDQATADALRSIGR